MASDKLNEIPNVSPPSWEALLALTETLWRAPNREQLFAKFNEALRSAYGVSATVHLRLAHGAVMEATAEEEFRAGHGVFSGEAMSRLKLQFRTLMADHPEYDEGIHELVVDDTICQFAKVKERGHAAVFIWRPAAAGPGLEMLVRQMQNQAQFFERLDETQELLHRDDLTGLYNRRFLESSLESEIRRAQRFSSQFCLLFIDLDNFKPVNDQFGHLAGSEVLRQVADVLKRDLREVDSVFRYGGDEYVVMLLGAGSAAGAMTAERIRKRLEETRFRLDGGKSVQVTASIGVAACPEHGLARDELLKMADQSMYRSKHEGKNRVFLAKSRTYDAADQPPLKPIL